MLYFLLCFPALSSLSLLSAFLPFFILFFVGKQVQTYNGYSFIHLAANNKLECVKEILLLGANINAQVSLEIFLTRAGVNPCACASH
jgi:hypothetical protein